MVDLVCHVYFCTCYLVLFGMSMFENGCRDCKEQHLLAHISKIERALVPPQRDARLYSSAATLASIDLPFSWVLLVY